VRAGEFVAVTGPSGSGKTTFLNIAGLLEELTSGSYVLDGVDVKALDDKARSKLRNEKLGFVFQSFNLIPDLDLFDNVDVPLRYRGFTRGERKKRIEGALERVGLASRMRHSPTALSGGQQQRVAIARAIAGDPKLLLADGARGDAEARGSQRAGHGRRDRHARSGDRRAHAAQRPHRRRRRHRPRARLRADHAAGHGGKGS
jgi:putative ABC transport system ATP-binding protein